MRALVQSTTKIVSLAIGKEKLTARIWEGESDDGEPVILLAVSMVPEAEDHKQPSSAVALLSETILVV